MPTNTTHIALAYATDKHRDQKDKNGSPYIMHPVRVAARANTEEEYIVGLLHDTIEDTDATVEAITDFFGKKIAQAVDAISKRKGEPNVAYYQRVKANPLALAVKMHDIADNTDPDRLAQLDPATRERLTEKYRIATAILQGE